MLKKSTAPRLCHALLQGSSFTPYLLTCGGLGSTTLPELEKLRISFGVFLIVMTHIGWAHSGQMAHSHHFGAVDLHIDLLWMVPNVQVTSCGLEGMGTPVFFWTSTTDTLPLNHDFLPIRYRTFLRFIRTCLACKNMNYCLTCMSLEMGCCVSGLVPIKNIVSTMWHNWLD